MLPLPSGAGSAIFLLMGSFVMSSYALFSFVGFGCAHADEMLRGRDGSRDAALEQIFSDLISLTTSNHDVIQRIRALVDAGGDVNTLFPIRRHGQVSYGTLLGFAIPLLHQRAELVKSLVQDFGADIRNVSFIFPDRTTVRTTPMHILTKLGNGLRFLTPLNPGVTQAVIQTMRGFAAKGAPLDTVDSDSDTLLHTTSHPTITRELVRLGVEVNGCNNEGKTSLHTLVSSYSPDTIEFLVEHGADVNAVDRFGYTPMHYLATDLGRIATLTRLGARIDVRGNGFRLEPIHAAAYTYRADASVVAGLIRAGANVNARARFRITPLHALFSYKIPDADTALQVFESVDAKLPHLLEANADVNARDIMGRTPLHYIVDNCLYALTSPDCEESRESIFWQLAEAGVDPTIRDNAGHTVVDLFCNPGLPLTFQRVLLFNLRIVLENYNIQTVRAETVSSEEAASDTFEDRRASERSSEASPPHA